MTTMKITIEDMGVTKTYEKDFGEGYPVSTGEYFEVCLEAYDQQGYCNDIVVNIYGLGRNITQKVTWDKDNYINVSEEMDAVDDLMSFLEQGDQNQERPEYINDMYESAMDAIDLMDKMTILPGASFEGSVYHFYPDQENWYMGYKF